MNGATRLRMKTINKIVLILATLLILPTMAYSADKWDKTDIGLAAAAVAVRAMDWRQSRYAAEHPALYREVSPVLSEHPSTGQVDAYFIGSVATQLIVGHFLPSQYRKVWFGLWIGAYGSNVYSNKSAGLEIRW
jgi:hypothetical protein